MIGGLTTLDVGSACHCCWAVAVANSVLLNYTRQRVDTFMDWMAFDNAKEQTIKIIATNMFDLTLSIELTSAHAFRRASAVAVRSPAAAM